MEELLGFGLLRTTRSRMLLPIFAVVLVLSGLSAYSVFGQSEETTWFACRDERSGTLTNVQADEPPTCSLRSAVISWGQTGPEGPQGPEGEPGEAGEQGPPGPPGPGNEISIVLSENESDTGAVVAMCPLEYPRVVGGGFHSTGTGVDVHTNRPVQDTDGRGSDAWQVIWSDTESSFVSAYALCTDGDLVLPAQ